jgi:hypothetical protein
MLTSTTELRQGTLTKHRVLQVVVRQLATVLAAGCIAQAQAPPALHLRSSGPFGFSIPEDWRRLQGNEQDVLKNAFEKQAQSLYGSYTNSSSSSSARVPDLDVQGWRTPSGSIFLAVGMTVPLEDHLMDRRAKEARDKAKWGVEHGLVKRASDVRPLRRGGYESFEIDFDNPDGSKTFTAGIQSLKEPTQLIQLQWTPNTAEQSSFEAFGRAVNTVHLLTVFGDYQPIEGRWLLCGAGLLLALLAVVGIRSAALRLHAKEGIVATSAAESETASVLEGEARLYWNRWLRGKLGWLPWPLILLGVGALGMLVLLPYETYRADRWHIPDSLDTVLEIVLFAILPYIGGLVGVVWLLILAASILSGPPQARRSPKRALRQFYNSVLPPPAGKDLDALEAYVCLTHSAKCDFAGITGFAWHWTEASGAVRAACGAQYLDQASVRHIDTTAGPQNRLRYCVTVKFTVTKPPKRRATTVELTGEMAQYGQRWYLLDGKWGGVSIGLSEQSGLAVPKPSQEAGGDDAHAAAGA